MSESIAPKGRPRSEAASAAVLAATFGMLTQKGYDAMSIEGIAAEAKVGKATVYRWWPSKAVLAVEAFFANTTQQLAIPETGSARDDFATQILALMDLLRGPHGRALAAMLGGARNDRDLAGALREQWLNPRRQWGFQRMQRAQQAGQLKPGVDLGAALALLYGPLYTPLLFDEELPSPARAQSILDLALGAIFVSQA